MRPDHDRILVGLDADGTAPVVLAVARRLAAAIGAELEAVHVGTDVPAALTELAATVDVDVVAEPGDPVEVLRRHMDQQGVVVAVVGCREEGGPRPAGHVSLGLVEHASVPVVVVPPQASVSEVPLHDVLLPLDGSRATEAAVEPTVAALAGSGLQVTVAHVLEAERAPRFLDQPHHGLEAWGREFLARHASPDLDLVLRAGRPGEQLLDVVAATGPDLVVLGWSQDLSPGHARTIQDLLADSPVPLLLVPTAGVGRSVEDPRLVPSSESD